MKDKILAGLTGALIVCVISSVSTTIYEARVFSTLASEVRSRSGTDNKDSLIKTAVSVTHELLYYRSRILPNAGPDPLGSLLGDVLTASGACGSYSKVLVRILQDLGIEARIGIMNGGIHIIAEAKGERGWVAADALYNLTFKTPYTTWLASVAEISTYWDHFKTLVPPGYNPRYNYGYVRYKTGFPLFLSVNRSFFFTMVFIVALAFLLSTKFSNPKIKIHGKNGFQ